MKYKISHELARELLAGPDLLVIMTVPVFDMPGCAQALLVKSRPLTVQGRDCIVLVADCADDKEATENIMSVSSVIPT